LVFSFFGREDAYMETAALEDVSGEVRRSSWWWIGGD